MTQYIALIHGNSRSSPSDDEWDDFFSAAAASGMFRGGSELGTRILVGDEDSAQSTRHIVGFMRFDSADRGRILELLERHPVVRHGGSVELCEMPRSSGGSDGGCDPVGDANHKDQ